jgi:1,4-dihydroxy-2-naphthoyl-CoA hydrolase
MGSGTDLRTDTMTDSNFLKSMPFAERLGAVITSAEKTGVSAQLIVSEELCTAGGIMHGGAIMTLADSLGAVAGYLNLPQGAQGTTTIESKTNFVAAARLGTTIRAVTKPISVGSRLSVWQTILEREDGRTVAVVTQTQMVL